MRPRCSVGECDLVCCLVLQESSTTGQDKKHTKSNNLNQPRMDKDSRALIVLRWCFMTQDRKRKNSISSIVISCKNWLSCLLQNNSFLSLQVFIYKQYQCHSWGYFSPWLMMLSHSLDPFTFPSWPVQELLQWPQVLQLLLADPTKLEHGEMALPPSSEVQPETQFLWNPPPLLCSTSFTPGVKKTALHPLSSSFAVLKEMKPHPFQLLGLSKTFPITRHMDS